jgi:hypothetical protein
MSHKKDPAKDCVKKQTRHLIQILFNQFLHDKGFFYNDTSFGRLALLGSYIKVNKCNTQLMLGLFVEEQMLEGIGNKVGKP